MKKVLFNILYPIGCFLICFAAGCLGAYFLTEGNITSDQYLYATIWGLGAAVGAFLGCITKKERCKKHLK